MIPCSFLAAGLRWRYTQDGLQPPSITIGICNPTAPRNTMKIIDIRLTGLAGATPEGGWADELKPEDDLHTIVEVITDEGLSGVGSAMTSKALVAAAVKLLRPL